MSYNVIRRVHESDGETEISARYWAVAWALLVAFFLVGDSVTTYYGVYHHPAVTEAHPVSQWTLGVGGVGAILVLKLVVTAIVYVLTRVIENDYISIAAPAGPAALGLVVTTWNVLVLFVFAA